MFIAEGELKDLDSTEMIDHLSERFVEVESATGRSVRSVYLSIKDYAEIRKYMRDCLSPEIMEGLLQDGVVRTLWGASLIVTRRTPYGMLRVKDTYEEK
jgi:hypothetical protein